MVALYVQTPSPGTVTTLGVVVATPVAGSINSTEVVAMVAGEPSDNRSLDKISKVAFAPGTFAELTSFTASGRSLYSIFTVASSYNPDEISVNRYEISEGSSVNPASGENVSTPVVAL